MVVGVIGSGPVGLYTAFKLVEQGHSVVVFERAGCVAANMAAWKHVRLFSALELNLPACARLALETGHARCAAVTLPAAGAYLTGAEFRELVLEPLARYLSTSGRCRVAVHCKVVGVARAQFLKGDAIVAMGDSRRSESTFRVVIRDERDGSERCEDGFRCVVDASGTYSQDTALRSGSGGVAAPGEQAAEAAGSIQRLIPDLASGAGARLVAGRRVAVLGAGFSAITTLKMLAECAADVAPASVTWLVRSTKAVPYARTADDPLPQRDTLAAFGNGLAALGKCELALAGGAAFEFVRGCHVDAARVQPSGALLLELSTADGARCLEVDTLISLTGFKPDAALHSELHVHHCYASDGPIKLAATLLAAKAGGGSGDCLAQAAPGAATLLNPEPFFYILGMKSYGRNSSFLMRVGYEQTSLLLDQLKSLADNAPFDAHTPR